ncbi:MAG: Fic family protein [Gemmatimonadota bacterium]
MPNKCPWNGLIFDSQHVAIKHDSGDWTNSVYYLAHQLAVSMRGSYPHLSFRRHWQITPRTQYELGQCDAIIQAISNTPLLPNYHERLLTVSLTKGAQATTAIEGNTLSEEEVRQVAAGATLPPSKEYQQVEVRNILDAFNTLLDEVAGGNQSELISPQLLLRFHRMIGQNLGAHFDAIPGEFRRDNRVVGPYRTPEHEDVPELVETMCRWLAQEFHFSAGQSFDDAVIQAIVTHLYIEWIHPFGDGNGRTGRLVEFSLLLRAGNPDIASHILSNFYNETRSEYYRQIDLAYRQNDLSGFISYAVQGFRDGLRKTLTEIQRSQFEITWRKLIYDRFADRKYTKKSVHKRQQLLALSLPIGQWTSIGSVRLLTPEIARHYATLSDRTVRRDLDLLLEMQLVLEHGDEISPNSGLLQSQVPRKRRPASTS